MEPLREDETLLQGFWLDLGSRMVPDANWERINQLIAGHLELLARGSAGSSLHRDPTDGRYWEKTPVAASLPEGPPRLENISPEQARSRYPEWAAP